MKVSIEVGDKVFYRGGKTPWTVIETPETSMYQTYKLTNVEGDKHKRYVDATDLRLILEIEKADDFGIFVKEI